MLRISPSDFAAIRCHGEQTYPHECCGILIGTVEDDIRTVLTTVRCNNICDSPQTRYDIDPRELIRAQRDAHERGLDIVGFYHSHPDHPAHWSPTDLEQAHWIGCSYVITSVDNGIAAETRSFALTGTREEDKVFAEEGLVVDT
jgi:proteasome lid subunit RPN8/RPN11